MDSTSSKIIADFYDANLDESRWPQALISTCEWIGADFIGMLFHDYETGEGRFEHAIGLASDAQSSYRRLHARSNAWLQAEEFFRKAPSVVRGSAVVDHATIKASAFYRSWLKNTGLGAHVFAVIDRSGSRLKTLVLARHEGKPDFDAGAVDALATVLPSVIRSLRAGVRLNDLRALDRAALRAVDAMPIGVIVLDRNAAVLEANRFARTILDAGESLSAASGTLITELGGRRLKLRDMMVRMNEHGALLPSDEVSSLSVPRGTGQRPLTLLLLPLEIPAESDTGPAALLFVGDPERPAVFDQTRVARLYGLSRAESRVAALIASGYRLEQVAEALDIAYETVRKHLKQIFGKTGTYRQAELVRMLVTGPAGLAL